jgi:hypothetical protein
MVRRSALSTKTVLILFGRIPGVSDLIMRVSGMVIVGGVDGNRLWGKELRTTLCEVCLLFVFCFFCVAHEMHVI